MVQVQVMNSRMVEQKELCGTVASSTWIEADWNVDNDSGGGDGNQYAPEGFDPFSWANDGTSCANVVDNDPCAEVTCEDGGLNV